MALTNTGKLIIGLTSTGVVVGGSGAGIYYLNSSKEEDISQNKDKALTENKVSNKLSKFGYSVLKTEGNTDNTKWQKVLDEYIKVKEEVGLHKLTHETLDGLKNECKAILNSENDNYSFAKRFCVEAETIDTMLSRNGYTKVGENTSVGGKAKWKKKLDLIKQNETAKSSIGLVLKNDENDSQLLFDACGKIETTNIKTYENKEFEKNYNNAKNWCYLGSDEK